MIRRLELDRLRSLCAMSRADCSPRVAGKLAAELGSLARWWLRDEVLERAAHDPILSREEGAWWLESPRLPGTQGSCWVLFRNTLPETRLFLRDTFLLPLRWVAGSSHSRRLPRGLHEVADSVVAAIHPPALRTWGLHLSSDLDIEEVDLSGIPLDCRSGWVPLAAGLILQADGGLPDSTVWATGCWDPHGGVTPVDDLEAKVRMAGDHGAKYFFAPEGQLQDLVDPASTTALELGPLSGALDPRAALRDYLARLDAIPPQEESEEGRDRRASWFLRQIKRNPERARWYYRNDLLPSIAARCREQLATWKWQPPSLLVTIASDNPELVVVAVEAIRPRRCLVLYTSDKESQCETALELLRNNSAGCRPQPAQFKDGDDLSGQLAEAVQRFVEHAEPTDMVFDLTPGHKLMSLTLAYSVARPNNWLLYLRHRRDGSAVVPFTEELLVWPAGQSWERFVR